MNNIKITTSDELIQFVKNTDLTINQHNEIVGAFYNHKFIVFSDTTKENLLSFIEVCKYNQSKDVRLPMFIGQKIDNFNIKDLYCKE